MPVVIFDEHADCKRQIHEALRHHERCQNVESVIEERADGVHIMKPVKRILQGKCGLVLIIGE